MKETLSDIALFTGIPADLIAIVPVVYKVLSSLKLVPAVQFDSNPITLPNLNIQIPVKEASFTLVFYGFVAVFYSISQRIENEDSYDVSPKLRSLSITPALFLVAPAVALLSTFGYISLADGLAIESVVFLGMVFLFLRWRFEYTEARFRGIGAWFLTWIPLTWLCFQVEPTTNKLANVFWALAYSSVGYVVAVLVVFSMVVYYSMLRNGANVAILEPLAITSIVVAGLLIAGVGWLAFAFLPTWALWSCGILIAILIAILMGAVLTEIFR